ncbi:PQQ-dependent sugar dehydrogenase [Marinomonas transparens]|uniref:PQQ-dependent sugar dehydrogenase n=1 Tax=Marinomonas transparens TaxID=2795388 RepID=A0A934JUK1_9GAMM|nr:PQQ-dependent sugar dehydrogenase [Marinomonas transparens]MBJ7537620.1 PQQ-dependent sugar dehydrogenase [Marinomonas transparens]
MKKWLLFLSTLMTFSAYASNTDMLKIDQVSQLNGIPWGISLINDQEAIVTIKQGKAYRVNLNSGKQQALTGLPKVDSRGQGGLLDVAKSPHFKQDSWLYFTYAKPTNKGSATTLARAKLAHNVLSQWQDLLVTDSASSQTKHYGSRIAFDDQDHVFFSVGERGTRKNAQDLTNHAGSIIRLNLDGSVPADNPFVGHGNVKNEIWSYGHRNPQGLFYDLKTHTLWANEHGPRGGDEINLIRPSANYGWPIVSHGKEYWGPISVGDGQEKEGIDNPIKVYTPSIAPSSMIRYRGELFSNWQGDFLSTALALRHLNRIRIEQDGKTTESRYLEDLNERLRSIAQDSAGVLYIGTDTGKLLKVSLIQD